MKYIFLFVILAFNLQYAKACQCNYASEFQSIEDLQKYVFIAHVKIIKTELYKRNDEDFDYSDKLIFQIIELFKGDSFKTIKETMVETSCDMGISEGEEWVLFGELYENEISVGPCDFDFQCRDKDGFKNWKYLKFSKIEKLRKIFNHQKKYTDGKQIEFYSNSNKEIEETYKNGKLNGERKIWYPDGTQYCIEFYINDTLEGVSKWFFRSGQLSNEDYYVKGKNVNVSRSFYDSSVSRIPTFLKSILMEKYITEDSLKFTYNRVQVSEELIYDADGKKIIKKEFDRIGKIKKEIFYDKKTSFQTTVNYYKNGNISSILYCDNDEILDYQEFDENGFPKKEIIIPKKPCQK